MLSSTAKKLLTALGILLAICLGAKYVLPVAMPFLLGGLLALAAEPVVSLAHGRLKLSRGWAAGIGVGATLALLAGLLYLLGALMVKEAGKLAAAMPELVTTASGGLTVLRDWLLDMSGHTPDGIQPVLTQTVQALFDDSSALMTQVTSKIPTVLTSVLSGVPNGALSIGTGLLASFLISARLPKIKAYITRRIPAQWKAQYLPVLQRVRRSLGGWLKAQGILAAVTYGIVALGFLLLRVPYGLLWALLIAALDAVPMLGTGLVLVPWAAVSLLQREPLRAIGLLCIFGAATITRSTLEPRLVGRQLGLDPLVTLAALYAGYRLWGFWGLIAAPILATAVTSLWRPAR